VLADVMRHRAGRKPVKVWSAASSIGAEPYTLAMVLSEFASAHRGFDYTILATDLCTQVLDSAVLGIYPEAMLAPVPVPLYRRYVLRDKNPKRGPQPDRTGAARPGAVCPAEPDGHDLSGRYRLRRHLLPEHPDLFRQADPERGAAAPLQSSSFRAAISSWAIPRPWRDSTCR